MRSKGYSIMEYGLYSVLFFNQFVDATAIENIHWRFYIVFVVFLVVETIIVYFFYVETRYVPLEEITKLFDGDKCVDQFCRGRSLQYRHPLIIFVLSSIYGLMMQKIQNRSQTIHLATNVCILMSMSVNQHNLYHGIHE